MARESVLFHADRMISRETAKTALSRPTQLPLTRDIARYQTYFPAIELITPDN
jgi:hypothetical protein